MVLFCRYEMSTNLFNATLWSSFQRFGSLAIGFISNLLLARLLCPEDYGTVGMIMVFVGLTDVLVEGGLGNALIQKQNITDNDTLTVFSTYFFLSSLFFLILFVSAPFIESYVLIKDFSIYLRVVSTVLIIRSFYLVPFSLLNKRLDFKSLTRINLISQILSTIIAVTLAMTGFGIWSLIIRNLMLDILACIMYIGKTRILPHFFIDKKSFKSLFGFGAYVALANLAESFYASAISFVIGKKFSVKELGYYNQAYSLEQIPVYSLSMVLNQVFFPILSEEQHDLYKVKADTKKGIQIMSFFLYPLMVFLIIFSDQVISILYSEKWLPSSPIFKILCVIGFFNYLYHLNRSILKALNKTSVLFYTQIISGVIGIIIILCAIPYGLMSVVAAVSLNSFIGYAVVGIISGKLINYSFISQIRDILSNFLTSVLSGLFTLAISSLSFFNMYLTIILGFIIFIFIFILLNILFRPLSFKLVYCVVKSNLFK